MKNSKKSSLEILSGKQLLPMLDEVARFRLKLFREFPYLYEGTEEYEKNYLQIFVENPHALLILFKINDQIVGIATGLPLHMEGEIFKEAIENFKKAHFNPEQCYYIGEVLVLPEFRGRFFSFKFIKEIENKIKDWGYKYICFMTVVRDKHDPRQPGNYRDLLPLWQRLRYQQTDITLNPVYPTIQPDGKVLEVANPMIFWIKKL
jgi:GNAT superfamily N-acetyltransferase